MGSKMNKVFFSGQLHCPSKIVCVGRNYAAHIEELNNAVPDQPVLFIKPNSAISSELRAIPNTVVHYEAEISFIIQGGAIVGVGFGLDLTKRDLQASLKDAGLPWERAKSFDGAAVFSDFVPFNDDVETLRLELAINGKIVQAAGSDLMLTRPAALMTVIGENFTLLDGDLVMTGTPRGVGPLQVDDVYEGKIFSGGDLLVSQRWVVV